jgi:hypothetical protein
MVELLPYQDGSTLLADEDQGSIEILDSATTVEFGTHIAPRHYKEVFMASHEMIHDFLKGKSTYYIIMW